MVSQESYAKRRKENQMKLPELNQIKKTTDDISEFGGYNHNLVIGGNEFYDDLNMSADHYPVLTQRKKRHAKEIEEVTEANDYRNITLCSNDEIAYMIGGTLHYNGNEIESFGVVDEVDESGNIVKKNNILISMGDKICSFPAGKIYNIKDVSVDYIRSDYVADFSWAHKANFLYTNSARSFQYKPTGDKNTGKQFDVTVNIPLAEFANQSGTESFATYMTNANNSISALINPKNATMVKSNNFSLVSIKYVKRNGDYITLKIRLKAKKKLYKNKKYTFKITKILINADNTLNTNNYVNMCIVNDQGNPITYTTSATAPASPTDGMYWLDISKTPNLIKMYSASKSNWEEVKSSTYRFSYSKKFSTDFEVGDTVTVTSSDLKDGYAQQFEISNIATDGSWFEVKTMFEFAALVITKDFKIQRSLPDFEYACECNNRIFGVSNTTNEIYACKLGDPMNWNTFMGLADDSYSLKFGTEGPFTGIFNYMGTILIFKENYIHRLYGTKPSNYAVDTLKCDGIAADGWDSCALIDGTLFYKGTHGIYAYSGNMPVKISDQFGVEKYSGGRGGAYNGKYYIYFDECGFSYDVAKGIWHKENSLDVVSNLEEHLCNLFYISKTYEAPTEEFVNEISDNLYSRYIYEIDINGIENDEYVIESLAASEFGGVEFFYRAEFPDTNMSSVNSDWDDELHKMCIRFILSENCKKIVLVASEDTKLKTADPWYYDSTTSTTYVHSIQDILYMVYMDSEGESHKVFKIADIQNGWTLDSLAYFGGTSGTEEMYISASDIDPDIAYHFVLYDVSQEYDTGYFQYNNSTGTFTKKCNEGANLVELYHEISLFLNKKSAGNYKYYLKSLDHFDGCEIEEDNLTWYAETGNIGFSMATSKWVSKILVRAEVAENATFKIEVSYDDPSSFETVWTTVYQTTGTKNLNVISVPIISKRCDHLRYRFSGIGTTKIYSITKFIESGSELHYGTY